MQEVHFVEKVVTTTAFSDDQEISTVRILHIRHSSQQTLGEDPDNTSIT